MKNEEILRCTSRAAAENERTALIIAKIKEQLEASVDEDTSFCDISRRVGLSRYHMTHMFKKHTGMTLIEYKQKHRIEKARRLLAEEDLSIARIALECGYSSTTYFSSTFQKYEGISPREYRRRYHK